MTTTMMPTPISLRRAQRGVASLLVALMLLLGGTIMAFFANRAFIFEQRTSANQYRATKAFELAEAGVEWALGKLNENAPLAAGPDCGTNPGAPDPTFRSRYATPSVGGSLNVSFNSMPSCRIDAVGVAACICPDASGTTANHPITFADQGRFGVRFRGGADGVVEIIARGCTNGTVACDPLDNAYAGADATAVVSVVAKVVPTLPGGPAAPLTAGSVATTGGSTLRVVNTDAPSNGITIHSGAGVQTGSGTTVFSLPGSPSSASIVDNDPTLSSMTLAAEDARFAAFSGQTLTNYRTVDPDVIRIGSCSAAACGTQVMSVVNSGVRQPRFFVDGDITFDSGNVGGSPIGTATNPAVIVSNGTLAISASVTAHGLFHAAAVTVDGTGTSTISGAFVIRGAFGNRSGALNLIYDPSMWSASAAPTGRLVKVPGSWRDKATNF